MVTAILILIPFLVALACFFSGSNAKKIALSGSVVELGLALYTFIQFSNEGGSSFDLNYAWIKDLGINFHIGLDGPGMMMVLLTALLTPIIIYSSFSHEHKSPGSFYGLILFMQVGLTGVFVAYDAFLFYIFWELALIPIYFIAALWGGKDRIRITLKFFIYTIAGSLLMLVAFIFLYVKSPDHSFSLASLQHANIDRSAQGLIFWAFFIAFAVKIPIFPFHTWQPDTYTDAPAAGTMMLSGIMLKMGLFGMIRWMLPLVPLGMEDWGNYALVLAVGGVLYASFIALAQTDLKRMIAYVSMAHVGLIAAGIMVQNPQAYSGAILQMFSHGITVVGLFFVIDVIEKHTGTRLIEGLGGIAKKNSLFAITFMVILLGSIALPLTSGFPGEFLILSGLFQYNAWLAAFGGLTIILGAYYMLRAYQRVMLGEVSSTTLSFQTLEKNEKIILLVITLLVVGVGIYPKIFLDVINNSVLMIAK